MWRFLGFGSSGTYKLTFELSGFQKLTRENIQVAIGQTLSVEAQLPIASLAQSVTVTGASPVVDVRSTKIGNPLKGADLIAVPNSTDVWGALSEAPGIRMQGFDIGGGQKCQQSGYESFGLQNRAEAVPGRTDHTQRVGGTGFYEDCYASEELSVGSPSVGSLSPSTPTSASRDQAVTVSGSGFRAGLTVTVFFPNNGGSSTLSGAQIQNVSATSFAMIATPIGTGTWSLEVNNPDGRQTMSPGVPSTRTVDRGWYGIDLATFQGVDFGNFDLEFTSLTGEKRTFGLARSAENPGGSIAWIYFSRPGSLTIRSTSHDASFRPVGVAERLARTVTDLGFARLHSAIFIASEIIPLVALFFVDYILTLMLERLIRRLPKHRRHNVRQHGHLVLSLAKWTGAISYAVLTIQDLLLQLHIVFVL